MRPLFTIHAGELVVANHIEKNFKFANVWVPSKDTGIDLLVTNKTNKASVSLQVKLSKDYKKSVAKNSFEEKQTFSGWFTLTASKIRESQADYWVFVLVSTKRKVHLQYIIISPTELLRRLENVHGQRDRYNFYPCVLKDNIALDFRDLDMKTEAQIAYNLSNLGDRNFSIFLNYWSILKKLEDIN